MQDQTGAQVHQDVTSLFWILMASCITLYWPSSMQSEKGLEQVEKV